MRRAAFSIFPVLALAALAWPEPVEAKSKAYCREWAREVADRAATEGGAASGVVLGLDGDVPESQDGYGTASLGGSDGSGGLTNAGGDDRWQKTYRRAYAECRAS